jgi:hypothetical protein
MASFRTIAAVTAVTSAVILATMSTVSAQSLRPGQSAAQTSQGFSRCPKSAEQYADIMRQLVVHAARTRALADDNPLLEPDAAFYEAELAATKTCAQTVATLATH